jgi:hypothetical protein
MTWSDEMPRILPKEASLILPPASLPSRRTSNSGTVRHPVCKRVRFVNPSMMPQVEEKPRPAKKPRVKIKADPQHIAAARELRDRWLEKVNENPTLLSHGKYDVSRLPSPTREPMKMLAA